MDVNVYKYIPIKGSGSQTSNGFLQPQYCVRYNETCYFTLKNLIFFRSKNAIVNIRSRGDKCLRDAITCGISSYFYWV